KKIAAGRWCRRVSSQPAEVHGQTTRAGEITVVNATASGAGGIACNRDFGKCGDVGTCSRTAIAGGVVIQSAAQLACDRIGAICTSRVATDNRPLIDQQVHRVKDSTTKSG